MDGIDNLRTIDITLNKSGLDRENLSKLVCKNCGNSERFTLRRTVDIREEIQIDDNTIVRYEADVLNNDNMKYCITCDECDCEVSSVKYDISSIPNSVIYSELENRLKELANYYDKINNDKYNQPYINDVEKRLVALKEDLDFLSIFHQHRMEEEFNTDILGDIEKDLSGMDNKMNKKWR